MFQLSSIVALLSSVDAVQVAVDADGTLKTTGSKGEQGKKKEGFAGAALAGKPKKGPPMFKGYQKIGAECAEENVDASLLKRPYKGGSGAKKNIRKCKKECDDHLDCGSFQVGRGEKCTIFGSTDVVASETGDCTFKSCCYTKITEIDGEGDEGEEEIEAVDAETDIDLLEITDAADIDVSVFTAINMTAEKDEFLAAHNKYRCMHGAANLVWND